MTAPKCVQGPVHQAAARIPQRRINEEKEVDKQGGHTGACHPDGHAKHAMESGRIAIAPVDHLGASLLDILHRLRALVEEPDWDAHDAQLDEIWSQWTTLSLTRNGSHWRTADATILRYFVRLAGKLRHPSLLSSISSLLCTSPDILPHHERVLHPGRTQYNITGKRVVLHWAVAQTMLGARDWSAIVRSLQDAGLAPSEINAISKQGMAALVSRVITDWLLRDPGVAFDLYMSASQNRDHLHLLNNIRVDLARTAIQYKHFDRAALLLAECTDDDTESPAQNSCVSDLVKALFDDAIVSVKEDVGQLIGRAAGGVLRGASPSSIAREETQQWQWCVLLLARSYCYAEAIDITTRLSSSLSWMDDFLRALASILCKAMRFADVRRVIGCIPHDHSSYISLHQLLFTHAAKADATRYAKLCWGVLSSTPRFRPSDYERLLWRNALRNERLGKRTSPLPITRHMQASDHRTLQFGHRLLTAENRFKLGMDVVEKKMGEEIGAVKEEGNAANSQPEQDAEHHSTLIHTDVCNSLLSSGFAKPVGSAKAHRRHVQKVFDTYAELTGNNVSTRSLPRFTPDLVTLNIMVKAWMQLDDVTSEMIQALFDRVVSLGYPSSIDRRTFLSDTDGPVFGTPLGDQSSQHSWLLQPLTSCSSTAISVRKHVLPLYRTFMKELYRRGDLESARTVVHIHKSVRQEEDLRDDVRLREKQLGRTSGHGGRRGGKPAWMATSGEQGSGKLRA